MAAELSLEALRDEIDRLDEVIVRLLDRRARCAYAIGRLKRSRAWAIYEPAREAAVMAHVRAVNAGLEGPLTAMPSGGCTSGSWTRRGGSSASMASDEDARATRKRRES